MKKDELEEKYGLKCGQNFHDENWIVYSICNDFHGNVYILRIRDSMLFSGLEVYSILDKYKPIGLDD